MLAYHLPQASLQLLFLLRVGLDLVIFGEAVDILFDHDGDDREEVLKESDVEPLVNRFHPGVRQVLCLCCVVFWNRIRKD